MFRQPVNPNDLRVIRTARSKDEINAAVQEGYWPLVQKVERSQEIEASVAVFQHKKTGEIKLERPRLGWRQMIPDDFEEVVPLTKYYPYNFGVFAAYLLPKDLKEFEHVWLDDVIEDIVGRKYFTNIERVDSAEAIWTGNEFIVLPGEQVKIVG